jgi:hypothetical protein
MNNFVVIRPKKDKLEMDLVIKKLREIANDPEYIFGAFNEKNKTASCSDTIIKYLIDGKTITHVSTDSELITPDFLFLAIMENEENFDVFGYNIHPK